MIQRGGNKKKKNLGEVDIQLGYNYRKCRINMTIRNRTITSSTIRK